MSTSGPSLATLDRAIDDRLGAVARRLRRAVAIEGLACLVVFVLIAGFMQFVLDYGLHGLRWSMRAAMLAVAFIVAAVIVRRFIVSPLRVRIGRAEVALLVERRYPGLFSSLISAVRFSAGQVGPSETNSGELAGSVVRRAAADAAGLDFNAVVNARRAQRASFAVVGVLAIGGLCLFAAPQYTYLWFARNILLQDVPYPKRTTIRVQAKDGVILAAKGDDVVISATADGVQPREVDIFFENDEGQRGRQTMVTVGSEGAYRYRHVFEKAAVGFTFYLRGGDDTTESFQVKLLERPRVTKTELRVVSPAYSKLEPRDYGDGQRAIQVLRGSTVTATIHTNHPVVSAALMAGDNPVADAVPHEAAFRATLSPSETRTYTFRLLDEAGLENKEQVRLSIQVLKDDAPRVRLKLPGVGDMIIPEAVLPMEMSFEDTYGLSTAEVVHQISREGSTEAATPAPSFRPGMTTLSVSSSWPVASVGVVPGERLSLYARGVDYDDVSGPNSTRSQEFNLRIVTRDELLAELARREREFRADFERLVDSQEQLRGRLLTALGRFAEREPMTALRDSVLSLERAQRNLAGSVNVVRQQFERILSELEVNQLDTSEVRERIGAGIVQPLAQLVRRDMTEAADAIGQWSATSSDEVAARIDPQQVELLANLRAVLAKMVYREGYQEVVNMLRDIIKMQQELNAESKKALEAQADEIFDQ